jgi:signal transduction histidine kinase
VDVTIAAEGNATTLSVRDSGPGIPAAEQGRVFDRFYRAPGTADTPGSGLGLAIVKSIADRHGASITLGTGIPGGALHGLTAVRFLGSRVASATRFRRRA